ncbi:Matrin-3 [Liparis tanakae]|uniref:Matrin-3 n=1 Tax=Liparis tanakae TaxID=230148 RepID=A0A4Z2F0B1_9TELE|nr:Matrin-3 [Liparis tanakae]
MFSQDYNHRPGPSDYGQMGRDSSPMLSQDYNHGTGPSRYGKTGRDTDPAPSQDRPSFSSAGRTNRTRASRFSQPEPADPMQAPHPEEHHPTTCVPRCESGNSSSIGSSRPNAAVTSSVSTAASSFSFPSKKEALDFHGTSPPGFPYSCSLCDITVMSEKVWIKHINGPHHADGQLCMLQQFPSWDCRVETISRPDDQSEKTNNEEKTAQQPQAANQSSSNLPPKKKTPKKTSDRSRVVCVRFPAQAVDEAYLRKLTEPFGKIVTVLMFPSLAFVELGSIDQAKDLVKYYKNSPLTVNGEQMEFTVSNTFNFLQSSRVVSFSPAPPGDDSQSDLMAVVKRFGSPLYFLFLPSTALIEMKNSPDAQKLVDYYSSRTLRINSCSIKVCFSGEFKSLMRVAAAQRYEEDTPPTKRRRSSSRENEDETKRKRRSREQEGEKSTCEKRTRSRSRDASKDKSSKAERSNSRDKPIREKTTRSESRERSTKETSTRTKSGSRDKSSREGRSRSRDKVTRTRSKSREKSTKDRRSRSSRGTGSTSREKTMVPEKTETATDSESRTDPDAASVKDSKPEHKAATEKEEEEEEEEEEA